MFHDGDQRPVVRAATTSPNLAVDQGLPKSFTLKWSNSHAGSFLSLPSHLDNGNDDDDSNVRTHIPRMNNGTAHHTNKGTTWHSTIAAPIESATFDGGRSAGCGKEGLGLGLRSGGIHLYIYMGGEVAQWVAHRWPILYLLYLNIWRSGPMSGPRLAHDWPTTYFHRK